MLGEWAGMGVPGRWVGGVNMGVDENGTRGGGGVLGESRNGWPLGGNGGRLIGGN